MRLGHGGGEMLSLDNFATASITLLNSACFFDSTFWRERVRGLACEGSDGIMSPERGLAFIFLFGPSARFGDQFLPSTDESPAAYIADEDNRAAPSLGAWSGNLYLFLCLSSETCCFRAIFLVPGSSS